jgi:TonB family protein
MSTLKTTISKPDSAFSQQLRRRIPEDSRQRGLMVGSLCLLVLALSIVLWHDREFWFPDSSDADVDQTAETSPVVVESPAAQQVTPAAKLAPVEKSHRKTAHNSAKTGTAVPMVAAIVEPAPELPSGPVVTSRTVLPPLEVEVVAGDHHRIVRPGSNALHVELEPGAPAQPAVEAPEAESAGQVTNNAADRVQMSADASAVVTSPVKPSYPLLARQMKVQGSVILMALIGRDGIIQNLRLVSGPRMLASAAEDAVRQWHFKPHLVGAEAVETQAKITVNFTISTN